MANPIPDQARVQELYLAVGTSSLADSLDLADFNDDFWQRSYIYLTEPFPVHGSASMNGVSFTRQRQANGAETMQIQIPMLITGGGSGAPGTATPNADTVIANEQAILTKLRQARRGAGAFALAQSVFLWMRIIGSSSYVYWSVLSGDWQPLLPKAPAELPMRVGVLTLTCLPFALGDPIADLASPAMRAPNSLVYRANIPGDVEALTHLRVYDCSWPGGFGGASRLTLYSRSIDGMASNDWTSNYLVTPAGNGGPLTDQTAINGTCARITTDKDFGQVAQILSANGAFQSMTDADVIVRVRDAATPIYPPAQPTASTAKGTGNLGGGRYVYVLQTVDPSQQYASALSEVSITIQDFPQQKLDLGNWIAGEYFTLGFDGQYTQILTAGVTASNLQTVLEELPTIGKGNVTVTGAAPTSTVQRITLTAGWTSFIIGFGGQFTPTINNDAQADVAHVQAALSAMPSIGPNNVVVSQPGGANTYDLTFVGAMAGVNVPPIEVRSTGTNNSVAVLQVGQVGGPYTISFPSPGNIKAAPGTLLQVGAQLPGPTNAPSISLLTPGNAWKTTLNWSNSRNTGAIRIYWQRNGGAWRVIQIGTAATTYTHSSETDGATTTLPSADGDLQPSEIKVGYGLPSAFVSAYCDAVPCQVSNGTWEYLKVATIPLPPAEIPEGMSAPPWFLTIFAANTGLTRPTLDIDEVILIPHDADCLTTTLPIYALGLSNVTWDIDTRRDHRVSVQVLAQGTLSSNGNEISDAVRATQGDGLAVPGGMGIWQGATNLNTNGNVQSTTAGYAARVGGETISRGTGNAKFSTVCGSVITPGLSPNEGVVGPGFSGTNGLVYSLSAWVMCGPNFRIYANGNATGIVATSSLYTGSATWQHVSLTFTAPANDTYRIQIGVNGTVATNFFFAGVQYEANSVATPYIQTDGSTASRPGANLTAPASLLLSNTQGWVAARIQMGISSTATLASNPYIFGWYQDANNSIGFAYDYGTHAWQCISIVGGVSSTATIAGSFNAGDQITVVGAWTATTVKISVNGSAFVSATRTGGAPTLPSTFFLGSLNGTGGYLDGSIRMMMFGTGTLSSADLTAINAAGGVPIVDALSSSAVQTAAWNGVMLNYWPTAPTLLGAADYAGQLLMGPGNTLFGGYAEYRDGFGKFTADAVRQTLVFQPTFRPRFHFVRGAV